MMYTPQERVKQLEAEVKHLHEMHDFNEQQNIKLEAELAKHQESQFHPDWSMLEATRNALKETQQECKRLRDAIECAILTLQTTDEYEMLYCLQKALKGSGDE